MPLNETAFCGKCSLTNNNLLFTNNNYPLTFNYVMIVLYPLITIKLHDPIVFIYFHDTNLIVVN